MPEKIICTLRPLQSPVSHNFYLCCMQVWHAVSPNTPQVPLLKPADVPPPPYRAGPTALSKGSFRHIPSSKRLICGVAFLDLLPLPLNPIKCNDANVFLEDRQRQSVQTKQKQWTIRYCKFWILFILTPLVVSRLGIRYNKGCSRQITPSVKNRYYLVSEPTPLVWTNLASRNKCQTSSLLFSTLIYSSPSKHEHSNKQKFPLKKHELLNSNNGLILFFRDATLSAGFVVPDVSNEHCPCNFGNREGGGRTLRPNPR